MSPLEAAVTGAGIGALWGTLAGVLFGLYFGERGRRLDAQNRETYGTPTARPARLIAQPPDAEARARDLGFDPRTVEKGKRELRELYERQGRKVSDEELDAQVQMMLNPDTAMEGRFPE